jgi:tetratricopeptide (TPR) repeat protein
MDPDGLEAYFTDVEDLRSTFRQLVSAPAMPRRLLVVHGVGGVGKSSLLRMFRIAARRAGVPIALASGDEVKSVVDLLADWSDDLQAADVRLPTIAKTIARYRTVQTTVERQAQKASAVAGKLAVKTAEGVAGSVAGAAIGSIFPVIGTLAGAAVGALVGTGGEALSDWLGTFLKRPDVDLVLDPTRQLTDAFLADINKAAAQQRIVLLLDTFEQLSALEDWARDFAQRLHPNVLLVIAGRALPSWDRAWPGWLAQTHIEELKPMTPAIMRELIERYYATMHGGEPDPTQIEAIIKFARGLPVVVTSAVQLWVAYGVEDFQSVKPQVVADLVDRLLEGVSPALVPILEAAATLRWFNKDLLRVVTEQDTITLAYDELRRFPFTRPRVEGLALHDAVREIIDESLRINDPIRHRSLHEQAALYFEQQLTHSSSMDTTRINLEILYHRILADEMSGMLIFQQDIEKLRISQLFNQVRSLLNDINNYPLMHQNSMRWREYYNIQELKLLDPKEAERCYLILSKFTDIEIKLRAYTLSEIVDLRRSIRFVSQPDGIKQLAQSVQESNKLLPDDERRKARNTTNLGKGYYKIGRFADAEQQFQAAIDIYSEMQYAYGVADVFATLAKMYALQGNWHQMAEACRQAVSNLPAIIAEDSIFFCKIMNAGAVGWYRAGQYAVNEVQARRVLEAKQKHGDLYLVQTLSELGFALGLQGKYAEAESTFLAAEENVQQILKHEDVSTLSLHSYVLTKQNQYQTVEQLLQRNIRIKQAHRYHIYILEDYYGLGQLAELHAEWHQATDNYQHCFEQARAMRHYFASAALTGLVRVKHALGDYAAIPALLAEAEALAQQYEYNDHLASLRLSQAQLAWDGLLPALGRGFDAALRYYQQALTYALRYNRFLLDEALWGGGVSTPLKPIIPHCIERTFEGQRMLAMLRDWWQSGANDIGGARPDTISPIPEGIALLEAERIAREREPGDGTPQRMVLEQLALHL